jgi:hypothetical protein
LTPLGARNCLLDDDIGFIGNRYAKSAFDSDAPKIYSIRRLIQARLIHPTGARLAGGDGHRHIHAPSITWGA